MDEDIKKMAEMILRKEFRERELLVACFVMENPDVPVDNIVFITHNLPDGGKAFQVREIQADDLEGGNKLH